MTPPIQQILDSLRTREAGGLLPCPFCGSEPHGPYALNNDGPETHVLRCLSGHCAVSIEASTAEKCIAAWNTRATTLSAPLAEGIAVCVEALERIERWPWPGGSQDQRCVIARAALAKLHAALVENNPK